MIDRLLNRSKAKGVGGRRWLVRGVLALLAWANVPIVQVKGHAGETFEKLEYPMLWGFAARPLEGAEMFVALVGGSAGHGVVVASADRRYPCPVNLSPGGACLYNHEGDCVVIKADRTITVKAEGKTTIDSAEEIELTAPQVTITSPSIDFIQS